MSAAALSWVRARAGRTALPAVPPPAAAPTEYARPWPVRQVGVWPTLLAHPARYSTLIAYLLHKSVGQKLLVPPEYLVEIMPWLMQQHRHSPVAALLPAVGERGRWLALQHPEWSRLYTFADAHSISEATGVTRRRLLRDWYHRDPEAAFDYVRAHWKEESVAEHSEWLKIFPASLCDDEVAFFQEIYEELLRPAALKKQANHALRRTLVEMLLRCPTSEIFQTTVQALRPYLQRTKSSFVGPEKWKWTLPDHHDAFFKPEIMGSRYEIDPNPAHAKWTDAACWLIELTMLLHPVAWEQWTGAGWAKILPFLEEAGNDSQKWPLLQQLAQSIVATRYRPAALAYTERYVLTDVQAGMLHALTNEELAAWWIKSPELPPCAALRTVVQRPGWRWSLALSRHVLKQLLQEQDIYQNAQCAFDWCIHLHPGISDDLLREMHQEASNWQQHQIIKTLITPLLASMRVRQEAEAIV